ncbi:MAG TPA: hypothetical protein V6D07_02605 [Trichocoleus sp.]
MLKIPETLGEMMVTQHNNRTDKVPTIIPPGKGGATLPNPIPGCHLPSLDYSVRVAD